MERRPELKCGQCYREMTVTESLNHRCPKLLDLLQALLILETLEEEKERKKEIQRRESPRKEIELKNELRRIQREEKEKQEGQKPKDRKKK